MYLVEPIPEDNTGLQEAVAAHDAALAARNAMTVRSGTPETIAAHRRVNAAHAAVRAAHTTYFELNRWQMAAYRQAMAMAIVEYRADPANLYKRLQLMESQNKICGVLGRITPKEAEPECARAARFMNATVLEPTNAGYRGYLAGQYSEMGQAYDSLASRPSVSRADARSFQQAALDMYRRSSEIWTDLRDRRLVNPTDTARVSAAALAVSRAEAALNAPGSRSDRPSP